MSRFDVKVLRGRDRVDSVEVLDLDDLEVVLFWDCNPRQATRMAEAMRADLRLPDDEFLAKWGEARPEEYA